jgi:hypothetical protein
VLQWSYRLRDSANTAATSSAAQVQCATTFTLWGLIVTTALGFITVPIAGAVSDRIAQNRARPVFMGSGLAASRRPGMTAEVFNRIE